jgi:hypothetical protein
MGPSASLDIEARGKILCEISSSHGGEYDVQSVDNHFTRQYNPEDSSEQKSSASRELISSSNQHN